MKFWGGVWEYKKITNNTNNKNEKKLIFDKQIIKKLKIYNLECIKNNLIEFLLLLDAGIVGSRFIWVSG